MQKGIEIFMGKEQLMSSTEMRLIFWRITKDQYKNMENILSEEDKAKHLDTISEMEKSIMEDWKKYCNEIGDEEAKACDSIEKIDQYISANSHGGMINSLNGNDFMGFLKALGQNMIDRESSL